MLCNITQYMLFCLVVFRWGLRNVLKECCWHGMLLLGGDEVPVMTQSNPTQDCRPPFLSLFCDTSPWDLLNWGGACVEWPMCDCNVLHAVTSSQQNDFCGVWELACSVPLSHMFKVNGDCVEFSYQWAFEEQALTRELLFCLFYLY